MAKKNDFKKQHDASTVITTPSRFGSHRSMVIDHKKENVQLFEGQVLCRDDTHMYITLESRLDNGLADPRRYA